MTAAININFAPFTFRQQVAKTSPMNWVIGCVGLGLCMVAAVMIMALMESNNVRKISLQRTQMQLAESTVRKAPVKKAAIPDAQVLAINGVIQQLNLPWTDVLDAIEEATPSSVALLSLEPDAKKHIVKGIAEAKSGAEMIAYIERIKKQEFFSNVALTKHEVNEQDANRPMRFQFEAQWRSNK